MRKTAFGLFLALIFNMPLIAQSWEMRVCAQPNYLPFSNEEQEGFENRVAEIIADDLDAQLTYFWLTYPFPEFRDHHLHEGDCDVVIGVSEGTRGYLTTLAYYRTVPVFVYRADSGVDLTSFDDPALEEMTIGVMGGAGSSPGSAALTSRGLGQNVVSFVPEHDTTRPFARAVEAVAGGEVDVAVVSGPVGGYFAERQGIPLEVVPVPPLIEEPFLSLVNSISVGVRLGDEQLRDRLNQAIARRWEDIQNVLHEYGVPLEPLPRPATDLRGG